MPLYSLPFSFPLKYGTYYLLRATHMPKFHETQASFTRGSAPEGSGTVWDITKFLVPFAFCHFFCSLLCNVQGTNCLVTCSLFRHWLQTNTYAATLTVNTHTRHLKNRTFLGSTNDNYLSLSLAIPIKNYVLPSQRSKTACNLACVFLYLHKA